MGSESVPIRLSRLMLSSGRSLENALRERRSVREYSGKPLTRDELAQLLWAAQGMTGPEGFRTAPSAGALYPLDRFPDTVRYLAYLNPLTYGVDGLRYSLIGTSAISPTADLAVLAEEQDPHAVPRAA